MHTRSSDIAGQSIVSPALVALCVMRARVAVRPRPAPEVGEMKRVFPLVLVSIALSVIVGRLVASGRLDAIRARVEESCEAMTQGMSLPERLPEEAVAA